MLTKNLHKWDIMQGFVTNGVINGKSVTNGTKKSGKKLLSSLTAYDF